MFNFDIETIVDKLRIKTTGTITQEIREKYAADNQPLPDYSKVLSFLSKIKPIEKYNTKCCWEWNGTLLNTGYGYFSYPGHLLPVPKSGGMVPAHRFSYWVFKGKYPGYSHVRHMCDNRKCVNPFHLELGSAADNMRDLKEKRAGTRNNRVFCNLKSIDSEIPPIEFLLNHAKSWALNLVEYKYNSVIHLSITLDMGEIKNEFVKSLNPFQMLQELDGIETNQPSTTEGGKTPAIHIDEEIFAPDE